MWDAGNDATQASVEKLTIDRRNGSYNVTGDGKRVWIKYEYVFGGREIRAFPSGDLYFLCKVAGKVIRERQRCKW